MLSGIADEIGLEVDVSCSIPVRVGDLAQSKEERDVKYIFLDVHEIDTRQRCGHYCASGIRRPSSTQVSYSSLPHASWLYIALSQSLTNGRSYAPRFVLVEPEQW